MFAFILFVRQVNFPYSKFSFVLFVIFPFPPPLFLYSPYLKTLLLKLEENKTNLLLSQHWLGNQEGTDVFSFVEGPT